jgi:ABC-2 type transport system permease protein
MTLPTEASPAGSVGRRPTPSARSRRSGRLGLLGLLGLHTLSELRASARTVEYVIVAVTLPALLFAMFGLPSADETNVLGDGTHVGTMMMVSMCCYGIVSLAIFTFGEQVAKDRASGWVRTMRATPLPGWSHLTAKLELGLIAAVLVIASTGGLAVALGNVRLDLPQWVGLVAVLLAGLVAFAPFGFAIAFAVRPRAASAIVNLIFLPLAFLSGFFVPLAELPAVLGDVAVWLPTYHFGQLAWSQVASASGVEAWVASAPQAVWVHVTWVLGATVVFSVLAVLAARRAGVAGRG